MPPSLPNQPISGGGGDSALLMRSVHVRDATHQPSGMRQGTLLEVKWARGDSALAARNPSAPLVLWCYVRFPDGDHRSGQWFPASVVDVTSGGGGSWGVGISEPAVSTVSTEITPAMLRQRESGTLMDFLEERLIRDVRTPPCVRYVVYLDRFVFQTWYYTPCGTLYPDFSPLRPLLNDCHLCPFSWSMFTSREQLEQHWFKAGYDGLGIPNGREVYRDDAAGVSLVHVSGARSTTFCRNLVLVGKAFLENKLAGHDVHLYYFYVLCLHPRKLSTVLGEGNTPFQLPTRQPSTLSSSSAQVAPMVIAGFFSWEKGVENYNLACIVTLPCFMAMGLGSFLISASYELAYRRGHVGTPERPLSDLGRAAYLSYWRRCIVRQLLLQQKQQLERDNKEMTGAPTTTRLALTPQGLATSCKLDVNDVIETLMTMGLVHHSSEQRTRLLVIPQSWLMREAAQASSSGDSLTAAGQTRGPYFVFDPKFMDRKRDRTQ